jgi:outer membrane autotransporter protein
MTKKSNILKNLLATASAVAVLAGGVESAMAGTKTPSVAASNTAHTATNADWAGGAPVDGDDLQMNADNVTMEFNAAGGANNFAGIDLNAKATPKLLATLNVAIGAIGNAGAGAANLARLTIADTKTATLNGEAAALVVVADVYDGLGIIDFGGVNSTLEIDANSGGALTLDNATVAGADTNGVLTATTSVTVTSPSFTTIKTINIADTKYFEVSPAISYSDATTHTRQDVAINLLPTAGGAITFGAGGDGELKLTATAGASNVFTLKNHLASGGAGKGVLMITATGNDGHNNNSQVILSVTDPNAPFSLGAAGAPAGNTLQNVVIEGDANSSITINRGVDLRADALEIADGRTIFKDKSVAAIKALTITAPTSVLELDMSDVMTAAVGATTIGLNTVNPGGQIAFADNAAKLVLKRTDANNQDLTFKVMNHIAPGGNRGIVELSNSSTGTGRFIVLGNGGKELGNTNNIKELRISGNKLVEVSYSGTDMLTVKADKVTVVNGGNLLINNTASASNIEIGIANPDIAGGAAGAARLTFDASNDVPNLLNGGKTITFKHAGSVLGFVNNNAADKTVILNANLLSFVDPAGGGIVELQATGNGKLIVTNAVAQSLSNTAAATDRLTAINSLGGTVQVATKVPVYANQVNVAAGSLSGDAATMGAAYITIGTAANNVAVPPVVAANATLILDAKQTHAANLLDNNKTIKFNTVDSVLQLTGTDAGNDHTFTLKGNLAPTLVNADTDITGILQLTSGVDNQALIINQNAAETIGIAPVGNNPAKRIKQLIIDGATAGDNRTTTINVPVYAKTITVGAAAGGGAAGSPITFTKNVDTGADGILAFAGPSRITFGGANVTSSFGTIDFATKAAVINVTAGAGSTLKAGNIANSANASVVFAGDGIFDVVMGDNKISSLTANGAGVVQILKDFKSTGALQVRDGGTVSFGPEVTNITIDNPNGITGFGGGFTGNVAFANNSPLTVNFAIGGGGAPNAIGTIAFAGEGDVTFQNSTLNAATLDFTAAEGIKVTTTAVDLGAKNIRGTSADNTLIVTGNQTLTGNIAAFGNLQVNNVSTVTFGATSNFAAGLTSGTANTVSVVVAKDGMSFLVLGSSDKPLKDVNFQVNASVASGTYTGTSTIGAGKTVSFGGPLTANTLTLAGVGSTANFADNAVMSSAITPTVPGEGVVNFAGSADVQKAIGNVKAVNFNADSSTNERDFIELSSNIGGTANFKRSVAVLNNNVNMTAGATFAGTDIDLGTKKLAISGGNVTLSGDVSFATTVDGGSLGNVVINAGAGNTVNLSGVNTLVVTVSNSPVQNGTQTYDFLTTTSGTLTGFDASKIKSGNADNDFVKWTVASDPSGKISLTSTNQTGAVLQKELAELNIPEGLVSRSTLDKLNNVEPGTQAFEFRNFLNTLSNADRAETLVRIENNTAVSNTEVISGALNDASSQISTRVASMIAPIAFAPTGSTAIKTAFNDDLPVSGVAAGDDVERHGIWASPFYGESTQKKRGVANAGYKARSSGVTAGFDTKATEDMIVGAAASFINTNVSHKDFKKGDKTKVDSLMFTVYGVQQMADNWYIQGVANFGSSRVKNNETRGAGNNKQVAKGNYTSMSFSGELLAGYNYMISEQAVVTPMAGFNCSNFNDSSYRETGTANQNLDVNKRATNKLEGIIGARVASAPYEVNGMAISPEAHAYVRHDMIGKNAKVDVRLDGLGLVSSKAPKPTRTFVNLGTGISAKYSMMEYGIGYDATMATKYIGHQGTVKVRVNF